MTINFGAPSSAPANSSLTGGFSFGANTNKPATGFGLGTAQPSTGLFGTPATSAPAFGATNPAFGATSTPGFGVTPSFGATTMPGFGATAAPSFGATSTPSFGGGLGSTGLSFGAGSNTITTSTAGLGFGAPISSATSGSLSFGAPTSTAAPGLGGFSFGPPASISGAPSLGFGMLGTSTATTATPCLFDSRTHSMQDESLAVPLTQTYQMIPSFMQHHYQQAPLGYQSGNNSDVTGVTNETCRNTDFVHLRTPTKDAYRILYSPFGSKPGLTPASTQPSTSVSLGLGGLAANSAGATGASDTSTAGKGAAEQQPKQNKLPNEIAATVDSFNDFVKKQKSLGADVMRVSIKPLIKVSRQAEETIRAALALSGEAGRARAHSRRLRAAAAKALAAAERAGRERPGLDSEGLAPPSYVLELISELESQLLTFRRQMDVADRQMAAPHKLLSEQELSLGMQRMHSSLIALAGRLQGVHAQVQEQKSKYLNLRRHLLRDNTDIFDSTGGAELDSLLSAAESSRKKRSPGGSDSVLSAVLADPRQALGSLQQATGPTPFTYLGSTLSNFPTADISAGTRWGQPVAQPAFAPSLNTSALSFGASSDASSSFQLQKPPKRGKQ